MNSGTEGMIRRWEIISNHKVLTPYGTREMLTSTSQFVKARTVRLVACNFRLEINLKRMEEILTAERCVKSNHVEHV